MLEPRILIVDDEERFRTTLGKRLTERKLDVFTVGSGQEALEELASKIYDVVILDVKMPGMDGVEVLREIKRTHPGVEVIMLTGHASVDSAIEGMRLGAYEYLMKPCQIDELMEKLREAYELKAARDERIRQAEVRRMVQRSPA